MIENAAPSLGCVAMSDSYRQLRDYYDTETGEIVRTDKPSDSLVPVDPNDSPV